MLLLCLSSEILPFLLLSTHLYTEQALFCLLKLLRSTPDSPPLFVWRSGRHFRTGRFKYELMSPQPYSPAQTCFLVPVSTDGNSNLGCQTRGFGVILDSPVAQMVKNLPTMQDTWIQCLGWEDPPEKRKASHSSTLAWKIPWTEEPDGLQSMGSQRVEHNLVTTKKP